ncbi:major facilitator superfamily domain-containing protein [Xylariales sp. PMI_506]|nr:major facilitator superfamily domain-containing protein [Xylariales sp. PMI_506]
MGKALGPTGQLDGTQSDSTTLQDQDQPTGSPPRSGSFLDRHRAETPAGENATTGNDLVRNGGDPESPPAEKLSAPEQPAAITGFPFVLLMVCVMSAVLQVALNSTILGTAIPAITNEFQSIDDVGWYTASSLITNCALAPFTGKLFRLFRIKATFVTFVAIFNLGSLLAGVARSSTMVIVARAVMGIGGAGLLSGSMTCIAAAVPIERRSLLNGILMGCFALGQAVAPLIGGAFTTYVSWRWCFYINLPLGGTAIVLLLFVVKFPELVASSTLDKMTLTEKILEIDLVGFFLFTIANIMLLMGLEWGGTKYPWNSPTVVGLLCGGAATFLVMAAWFWHRGQRALIPTRFFKSRISNAITVTTFAQNGGVLLALYWYPIWFQSIKEVTAMISGVMLLPLILTQLVTSVLGGALVQKTGYYLPEIIFGNMLIALGSGLTSTWAPSASAGTWVGYQILVGGGRGFVMQLLVTAMQANVPKEDASIASGFVMFSQFFGGAIFSSVAETIFTSSLAPALARYAPSVDPSLVINSGATELQLALSESELPGVLLAYNEAIVHVFYLQLATACCAFVTGWGMGWKNLKTINQSAAAPTSSEEKDGSIDKFAKTA